MARLYLDICLSDIPKERIKTAKNGKKYLKCIINPRKNADEDGYDHYIAVSVPQAERGDNDRPLFIGRAQARPDGWQGGTPTTKTNAPAAQSNNPKDDLPF